MKPSGVFLGNITLFFILFLFSSCSKEKKLIKDLEKGKWILESVFIRDICSGTTGELTETSNSGSLEFRDFNKTTEEGTGHFNLPVYPKCYSIGGYPKIQVGTDCYYSVIYGNVVQQIDIWTDPADRWGTVVFYTIREYTKNKKLVISSFEGDDYYGIYTEYSLKKE
ncbi:MAG: hypothetical protein HYY40_12540 [Bacteroidetes bacterium]|nr:hypothetical protein [Bacteroidota bacterium]